MARTDDDIFELVGSLAFRISLDWERIEADPVWRQTSLMAEGDRAISLQLYLSHYVARDSFLRAVPSTNGPGQLSLIYAENGVQVGYENGSTEANGS